MRGRRMVAMTRARPASYGLGNPPPLHHWMHAVLMLVVCLVQGVAATFRMRRWIGKRDWHAQSGTSALPQTKPDIQSQDPTTPTESLSALCRESLLEAPKGLANDPLETLNQDSRDKPENDTGEVETPAGALEACPLARFPGECRDPASAQRALVTRTILSAVIPAEARQRAELEPRSHARRRLRLPPLASGSRSRASGMTPSMCVQTSPI